MSYSHQIERWERLYKDKARLSLDLSMVQVPEEKEGFNRLLVVPQELAGWKVIKNSWYTDYDGTFERVAAINDRDPSNGTYAIWVSDRKRVKIPERGMVKVVNSLTIKTETLLERILHEISFKADTGRHLDDNNGLTICAGSRGKKGTTPYFMWYHRLYDVGGCEPSVPAFGDEYDIRHSESYVIEVVDGKGDYQPPYSQYWDI